jgi:hypothetical protein
MKNGTGPDDLFVTSENWQESESKCKVATTNVECDSISKEVSTIDKDLSCSWTTRPNNIEEFGKIKTDEKVFGDVPLVLARKFMVVPGEMPKEIGNVCTTFVGMDVKISEDFYKKYREARPLGDILPEFKETPSFDPSWVGSNFLVKELLEKFDPSIHFARPRDGLVKMEDWTKTKKFCESMDPEFDENAKDRCKEVPVHLVDGDLRCRWGKGDWRVQSIGGAGFYEIVPQVLVNEGCRLTPANRLTETLVVSPEK